jgi:hypothetical protein
MYSIDHCTTFFILGKVVCMILPQPTTFYRKPFYYCIFVALYSIAHCTTFFIVGKVDFVPADYFNQKPLCEHNDFFKSNESTYRTRAIITRGLYTFYPLFEVHLCTVTFGLMYG